MANLLDLMREEFFSRISTKTNWGYTQIQAIYNEVQRDVLSAKFNDDEILKEQADTVYHGKAKTGVSMIRKPKQNVYTPRGSAAYDSLETPIPDEDNPFHDDEDINKSDR